MRKFRHILYIFLPILICLCGWVVFNRFIRINHYQFLFPYSIFQFRNFTATAHRLGADDILQAFIPGETVSPENNSYAQSEKHEGFWIDQIPVTVKDYKRFLSETNELSPRYRGDYMKYWLDDKYALFPVVFVSWEQAESYCEYYGGHLPTEAQWEKASRGPDGIILYWNDDHKAYDMANYDHFYNGTTPSGWLPAGKTVYGILDMSGNAREWVLDWMTDETVPVRQDPWEILRDEKEPYDGAGRILKGGAFSDDLSHLRLNFRDYHDPHSPGVNRGFRCVYENE